MTWTDRIALLRIFLAWLFGSILLGYIVDKFIQRIKNRRPRSAKRKAAQTKTIHINCKRKAG
jgi:hypothetical protein